MLHSEVERLAALGLTVAQIADRVGVSRRTMHNHLASNEALRNAMDRGVAAAVEVAAAVLREEMLRGNLQAVIFFLRCKGGWVAAKEPAAPVPPPAPQERDREAPITLEHVDAMVERQRALLGPE